MELNPKVMMELDWTNNLSDVIQFSKLSETLRPSKTTTPLDSGNLSEFTSVHKARYTGNVTSSEITDIRSKLLHYPQLSSTLR